MTTVNLHGLPTVLIDTGVPPNAPLVVAMHGIGSNEHDLLPAYHELDRQAVLAFPRSPLEHPPGFAWYRLIRIGVPDPTSFEQAQQTLGGWLKALRAMPGHAERPLILSGFSQGAIMALSYALLHPDEVAGVMAFSGYIPEFVAQTAARPRAGQASPRFFLTQGRHDQLFPIGRLQETANLLESLGLQPTVAPTDAGHNIPLEATTAARTWLSNQFPANHA